MQGHMEQQRPSDSAYLGFSNFYLVCIFYHWIHYMDDGSSLFIFGRDCDQTVCASGNGYGPLNRCSMQITHLAFCVEMLADAATMWRAVVRCVVDVAILRGLFPLIYELTSIFSVFFQECSFVFIIWP